MCDDEGRGDGPRYSIGELAELGGVSRRTVRYYVQRGLLASPTGLGRGRHYTQRPLDELIRIRRLQEAGHGPAESAASAPRPPPEPGLRPAAPAGGARYSSWTRIEIADGVELHLRDARLDSRQALAVGEAILGILRQGGRR